MLLALSSSVHAMVKPVNALKYRSACHPQDGSDPTGRSPSADRYDRLHPLKSDLRCSFVQPASSSASLEKLNRSFLLMLSSSLPGTVHSLIDSLHSDVGSFRAASTVISCCVIGCTVSAATIMLVSASLLMRHRMPLE